MLVIVYPGHADVLKGRIMIRDKKKPHKPQKNGPTSEPIHPPNPNNQGSPGEIGSQIIGEQMSATVDAHFVLLLIVVEDLLADESLDANEWRAHIEQIRRNPRTGYISEVVDIVLWTMEERKRYGLMGSWLITRVLDAICAFDQESPLPPSDPRSLLQVWRKATGKSAFRPGSELRLSRRRASHKNIAPRHGAERS